MNHSITSNNTPKIKRFGPVVKKKNILTYKNLVGGLI